MVGNGSGPDGQPPPSSEFFSVIFRHTKTITVIGRGTPRTRIILVVAVHIDLGSKTLVEVMPDAANPLHRRIRNRMQLVVAVIHRIKTVEIRRVSDVDILVGGDGL